MNFVLFENRPPQPGQLKHFSFVCVRQCSFTFDVFGLVKVQSDEEIQNEKLRLVYFSMTCSDVLKPQNKTVENETTKTEECLKNK